MWHTDQIWISEKFNCNILFKLISIDPIRDKIMYWLMPRDVLNFVISTGIILSRRDMNKYTDIFKYIIPNRNWLMRMIEQGYTFTIIGRRLKELVYGNTRRNSFYDKHPLIDKTCPMDFILIVTKDGYFVSLTEQFMSTSLFMLSKNDEIKNLIYRSESRILTLNRNNIPINILCKLVVHATTMPISLLQDEYQLALAHEFNSRHTSSYVTKYSHASKNKTTILHLVEEDTDELDSFENTKSNLFCIEAEANGHFNFRYILFCIN